MSNFLKNNAFHVLGLNTSASQSDIQKRAKEITKFLEIDEVPTFDSDLGLFTNYRSKETVKEALQKATSPKKIIKEYFFWFFVNDDIDVQALSYVREKKFNNAIEIWRSNSEDDSTRSLFYKRNLAILFCILLFNEHNGRYLKDSVKIWLDLCNSSKFWKAFDKVYLLNDELNTNQEILDDFHKQCPEYLSDLYSELSDARDEDSYVAEFTKLFNITGENTTKAVLNPIFQEIVEVIEKLEAMNVSQDGKLDEQETSSIKKYVTKIAECSNKLIDLGLYDVSQSRAVRDRAAAAIRSITLDIHNNLDESAKAEELLKIAMKFVGTSGMKQKLKQDLDTLENNKRDLARILPISNLINDKQYAEAISLIDKTSNRFKDNVDLVGAMNAKKKEAVTLYAVSEFIEGKKLFEAEKYDQAAPFLQKTASIVYENIEIFDVNKDVIDSWLNTIKGNVKILTSNNANDVDEVQNNMLKKIDDAFDEKWEQMAIKVLINSYYYVGLGEVIKKKKASNLWSWVIWIIVIIVLAAIFG